MIITASNPEDRILHLTTPFHVVGFTEEYIPTVLSSETEPVEVTDKDAVVLRYSDATMGRDVRLTPVVLGYDGASIEWSSSDESVATVEDGYVTQVSPGTATITATISPENSASVTIEFTETGGGNVDVLQNYV